MVLNPNIMIDVLKNLEVATETEAAEAWADMIIDYLKTATGILPAGFDTAVPPIRDTLLLMLDPTPELNDGISVAALTLVPSAFAAVWGIMAIPANTSLFFAGAVVLVPPPTIGLMAAEMAAAAPLNLVFNGSGVPPSTGDMDQDKALACQVLVTGTPTPPGVAGTGFHWRNQGGTWAIPPAPPVVIL